MSADTVALTVAGPLLGAALGWAIAYYFFKRGGSTRPRLLIGLVEVARIDPSTVGVRVEMKVGTIQVSNIVLLEVTVANRGPHDIIVLDADDPRQHPLRPRIELPAGLRTLADPWNPDGAVPRSDVRVARRLDQE